ncbi:MAG: hypothetical protein K0S18_1796 [Anaerocolumna sp.]|jgi:uncharacterized membrane protein YesL|nr:hypothetical protein [Anaerocolumna sp.]
MGNLFSFDNGFFTLLGKLWDVLILGILYIILCIPIITIGPATTALYYATVKVIRRDRGYLIREFFHSFKMNFKNGVIVSILLLLFYIIMYIDRNYARTLGGTLGYLFFAFLNTIIFLLIGMTIYIFPVLSRFQISRKELFKTSFFMAIKHLPTTLLLIIIIGVFAFFCYIFNPFILVTPGAVILLCSFPLERIFKKYIPQPSLEADGNSLDKWYLE